MPTAFIVDDHPDTGEVLALFLESNGYAAEFFTDFKTAEHKIVRDHPGILFIDYHMSDEITTPEFIERMKGHRPNLKIVLVSGDPRKKVEAQRLGVEFIPKPIDLDHMEKLCQYHCGK